MKKAIIAPPLHDDRRTWMCCTVMHITDALPLDVDEARDILRIVDEVMRYRHGDRWKYTAEEFAQYLKGKNRPGGSAVSKRRRAAEPKAQKSHQPARRHGQKSRRATP